jgi:hypothetical protein
LFRTLTVLVDGEPRAKLGRGEARRIGLQPGRHRVRAKMDWCTSPELVVELAAGQNVSIRCASAGLLPAVAFTFLAPERVFTLSQE